MIIMISFFLLPDISSDQDYSQIKVDIELEEFNKEYDYLSNVENGYYVYPNVSYKEKNLLNLKITFTNDNKRSFTYEKLTLIVIIGSTYDKNLNIEIKKVYEAETIPVGPYEKIIPINEYPFSDGINANLINMTYTFYVKISKSGRDTADIVNQTKKISLNVVTQEEYEKIFSGTEKVKRWWNEFIRIGGIVIKVWQILFIFCIIIILILGIFGIRVKYPKWLK